MLVVKQALQCSAVAVLVSLLAWRPMTIMISRAWIGKAELSWELLVTIPLLCLIAAAAISLKPAWEATRVSLSELLRG